MIRETVHEGWRLRALDGPVPDSLAGREVPAQVPGSTHLDLLAADLIPDPYLDRAEARLEWMHRVDWQYSTAFDASRCRPGERAQLVFDGIDTVATVELNGRLLGHTANMHRSYRFDVHEVLRDGDNALSVRLSSALTYAEQAEARLGHRVRAYPHPYNAIRKMACSFGWDWGPDLQTAGLWRPVRLERWSGARLAAVRPLVTVDGDGDGRVEVHAQLDRARDTDCTLVVRVGEREQRVTTAADAVTVTVHVPKPALWWPVGRGEQPLYDLTVTLLVDDEPVDVVTRRLGFRTITLDQEPDEYGSSFAFVVNGERIFAKGANWIPDDHLLTRATAPRLARRVDQAVAANMNMLRVWGGGIYESDAFYDACDERGVLVWQDFPFACAAYSEEEPLRGEVVAEAEENVARLASHPSLALWNGNNENLVAYADWGWQPQLEGLTWGLEYYTRLLPRIVADLDPTRPYTPGSPFSIDGEPPNDDRHGTRHEWAVWNSVDYTHYRDHVPRFCAEFGFQGPPTWATLTRWITDEPLSVSSPAFLAHQKANGGARNLDRGFAPHLPAPRDFPAWHWTTQLNQARAVALGVEHFRSWWPRTAGALVWQLNDCWPVTSWAAIDGDGRLKPLWYALRHAFAPRLLTVQPRDDGDDEGRPTLFAINDQRAPWTGSLIATRQTFAGEVLADSKIAIDVPARSCVRIDLPEKLLNPSDPKREVLSLAADEARAWHLFAEDLELAYDPAPLTTTVEPVPEGYRVRVRAASFTRDIALLADKVAPDAEADDMLISLAAGDEWTFLVRTSTKLPQPDDLVAPGVLCSANALAAFPAS